jgi:GTP-binding protein
MQEIKQEKIRNIAIIAHVDHGKTTLVDAFLKQANIFRENEEEMSQTQILDSGDLEKEKGITITAKNISIRYGDYKINIVDTPGHADFGGEVERTLNMAEGCILVVDAQEGPMPQTKFVLARAMELNLKPIVVVNKIDKKYANMKKTLNKIYDLFLNVATTDDQLEFPVYYAIARDGIMFVDEPEGSLENHPEATNLSPLLEKIVEYIPAPSGEKDLPFQLQICSLDYDSHMGRYLIGKIKRGKLSLNQKLIVCDDEGTYNSGNVKKILIKEGLLYKEVSEATTGDIVAIAGIETTSISKTLCDFHHPEALPGIKISPPSVKIKLEANTSPLAGKDGKYVRAKELQARLEQEAETNISLDIKKADDSSYFISARGELQLSILMETMRREGFEFQVKKPEVIFKEIDDKKHEPLEELIIDIPEEYIGIVTEVMSSRRAKMINMETDQGNTRFTYHILTRFLFGLRNELLNLTKGKAILNHFLLEYVRYEDFPPLHRNGVLIASEQGVASAYALNMTQDRGTLFISPSEKVYEGMIVGINKYENDIEVNTNKERKKTNVRMSHAQVTEISLKSPLKLTLEYGLVFIQADEMLEVTPNHMRLRKIHLTHTQREWGKRDKLSSLAEKEMRIAR